jgi:hypothetical protein
MQKTAIIEEVSSQDLRDAKDKIPMGYLLEHIGAKPLPEFHHPLLVAGGAEMSAFAGEGQKELVVAVSAFHAGKAIAQVATIQVSADDLPKVGTEVSLVTCKM